jgi:hypothetical protein
VVSIIDRHAGKNLAENGMVPFSCFQGLINSRVMKKHSSIFEVWRLGASNFPEAWHLQLDIFAPSCLPAFLILIPAPDFKGFKVI